MKKTVFVLSILISTSAIGNGSGKVHRNMLPLAAPVVAPVDISFLTKQGDPIAAFPRAYLAFGSDIGPLRTAISPTLTAAPLNVKTQEGGIPAPVKPSSGGTPAYSQAANVPMGQLPSVAQNAANIAELKQQVQILQALLNRNGNDEAVRASLARATKELETKQKIEEALKEMQIALTAPEGNESQKAAQARFEAYGTAADKLAKLFASQDEIEKAVVASETASVMGFLSKNAAAFKQMKATAENQQT